MGGSRKSTLMQLQVSLPIRIAITIGIMFALVLIVHFCNISNPNMILIFGLVLCSAMFGYGGGVAGAVIMFGYSLFFYSTDHNITQFTPENLQNVAVSVAGIVTDMVLVCFMKSEELRAFSDMEETITNLQLENEHLKTLSFFDPVTGIRSRVALRQDFDSYKSHEVTVMMIDINNLKQINETYGHREGDQVLKKCGELITETFGKDCCYRYGGDEFLVIYQDESVEKFEEKLDSMMSKKIFAQKDGKQFEVGISAGYVHDKLDDPHKLRELFLIADERMYRKKRTDGLYG